MKNKLLLSGLALFSLTATAQQLHDGDVLWPNSQKLSDFVKNWTAGQTMKVTKGETNVNPGGSDDFEDENFFISRVKLKPLFRNEATQVYGSTINETNDKKLLNWVPVNKADGGHTDALPNGLYDSEVFSNWSYVTHWGDWISPYGWVPAALADAAHKHGVLVSGVASIPYGSISGDWYSEMVNIANLDGTANATKLAQFLYYHGVDGLGYNSEFSGLSSNYLTKIQNVHKTVMAWMADKGNAFENIWYDGTNDNGSIQFDNGLTSNNDGNFSGASLFFNYNWQNQLSKSVTYVNNNMPDRSSLDLYAGHNMQGGQPGTNNWDNLANYPISIGLWGAHNTNLLWAGRSANGSSPAAMQDTYQKRNEQWFTNAHRNPAKRMKPYTRAKFSPDQNWFGMSVYMSARSSLSWDLDQEPFISYFNLGNGTFLNWKGERMNNNEWYNLGVQDYMPTWRWWFASNFLGGEESDVPEEGLDAQFIWKDAWMGGSCLNIFGSTDKEYLHLFKTRFELAAGDVITVRYKLIGGKADAKLVFSVEGDESEPIDFEIFTTDQEVDDEWVEFTHTVGNREAINGENIAVIALEFDNAENMDLYLGEVSIVRESTPTPQAPKISVAKILRNNYYGADAKVIFDMENQKTGDEPCYNLDVNTSLFKLWADIDGEQKLIGITSSWAGLLFSIPAGDAQSIKVGVQAVSTDFNSESAITWSEDLSLPTREISEEIVLSQNVIKPNEPFTVGYLDTEHAPAKWEITNAQTDASVRTEENAVTVKFDNGIEEVAPYNVKVTEQGGNVREFNWMIQITDEKAGAVPQIHSISLNDATDEVTIEEGESVNVAYTGRDADGSATRGISAEEMWIGGQMGDLTDDFTLGNSFTVAAWIKYTSAASNGSSALFSIEDRTVAWPQNNWGWFWSNLNGDGTIGSFTFRSSYTGGSTEIKYTFSDTKIPLGVWTHIAIVFDYTTTTRMRAQLYINGIKQASTWEAGSNKGTTDDYFNYPNGVFRPEAAMWYSFFGGRGEGYVAGNGMVDDLQFWNKALNESEVEAAMNQTRDDISENLIGYWDFESDEQYDDATNGFVSIGKNKTAKASNFGLVSADGEGQAVQTPQPPVFVAGNPFLEGSGYPVVTKPTWSGKRAVITEADGTGASGSAKVTYNKAGDYTLTLTLANDYGTHSMDYPVVHVEEATTGIEDAFADVNALTTYAANDALYVSFGAAGNYEVAVYNIAGSLVAHKDAAVSAGQNMRIGLGAKGVYVVRIVKDGNVVKAFKILSR